MSTIKYSYENMRDSFADAGFPIFGRATTSEDAGKLLRALQVEQSRKGTIPHKSLEQVMGHYFRLQLRACRYEYQVVKEPRALSVEFERGDGMDVSHAAFMFSRYLDYLKAGAFSHVPRYVHFHPELPVLVHCPGDEPKEMRAMLSSRTPEMAELRRQIFKAQDASDGIFSTKIETTLGGLSDVMQRRAELERNYRRIEIQIDVDPHFSNFVTHSLRLHAHTRIHTVPFTSSGEGF